MKAYYKPSSKEVEIIDVPEFTFIMADGEGNPNTVEDFQLITETLYSFSYALKFIKKKTGQDYKVMPLEGLWWARDMSEFSLDRKDDWFWTLMILQPLGVTPQESDAALEEIKRKKKNLPLERLRIESFREGLSAQTMHIGPYADEAPTIGKVHASINGRGGMLCGKHHEIYIGDPRRSTPEKLKTIIRQPFCI